MESKEEIIQKYKEEQLKNIKEIISETGSLGTYMQLVGTKQGVDKPIVVHIETPFEDDDDKKLFLDDGIPMICKGLKQEEIIPLCVSFTAEAWMKLHDATTGKETEKKEVIIMTISSEDQDIMYVYEIIRHPYEVDESGELKSKVELSEQDVMDQYDGKREKPAGRFSNLYAKFAKGLL